MYAELKSLLPADEYSEARASTLNAFYTSPTVIKAMYVNPKAELCAFKGGEWIRVAGELVEDDRMEARQSMLDAYPGLKKMYAADDGNTEVFYFKNGVATISAFTHEPKVIKF